MEKVLKAGNSNTLLSGITTETTPQEQLDPFQEKVNKLFWDHGKHLQQLAGYEEILVRAGIKSSQLTEGVIRTAIASLASSTKRAAAALAGGSWKIISVEGTRNPVPPADAHRPSQRTPRQYTHSGTKADCDDWGTRLGTNRAKVNAAFNTTPQTVKQIAEAAGLQNFSCHQHLKELVERGLIVHTMTGYILATPPPATGTTENTT